MINFYGNLLVLYCRSTNGIKALSVVHWVLIGDIAIDTVFLFIYLFITLITLYYPNLPPFSCTCSFETCLSPHSILNTFCSSTKKPRIMTVSFISWFSWFSRLFYILEWQETEFYSNVLCIISSWYVLSGLFTLWPETFQYLFAFVCI